MQSFLWFTRECIHNSRLYDDIKKGEENEKFGKLAVELQTKASNKQQTGRKRGSDTNKTAIAEREKNGPYFVCVKP